jgi:hypothetical protein
MYTFIGYSLATGYRVLVLIYVEDGEFPYTLLDIPLDDPLPGDGDCRVVDHELEDPYEARDIAHDHYVRSKQLGRPAVPA